MSVVVHKGDDVLFAKDLQHLPDHGINAVVCRVLGLQFIDISIELLQAKLSLPEGLYAGKDILLP